jgi:hypothetical protein
MVMSAFCLRQRCLGDGHGSVRGSAQHDDIAVLSGVTPFS